MCLPACLCVCVFWVVDLPCHDVLQLNIHSSYRKIVKQNFANVCQLIVYERGIRMSVLNKHEKCQEIYK